MITLFTRIITGLLLTGLLCLGGTQVFAQNQKGKAAVKTEQPASKKADPAARAERGSARPSPRGKADLYYILLDDDNTDQKIALESILNGFSQIKMTEGPVGKLRTVTGDPDILARVRMAYPELSWYTAREISQIAAILQDNPKMVDPAYLEKNR